MSEGNAPANLKEWREYERDRQPRPSTDDVIVTKMRPVPIPVAFSERGETGWMGPLRAGVPYMLTPMNPARKAKQCKDIPDQPILDFLAELKGSVGVWFPGFDNSVGNAMPAGTPPRMIRAKMHMLIRRGLVDGCFCGCRGDYTLTEKGARDA